MKQQNKEGAKDRQDLFQQRKVLDQPPSLLDAGVPPGLQEPLKPRRPPIITWRELEELRQTRLNQNKSSGE